jgi:hypothetical protein
MRCDFCGSLIIKVGLSGRARPAGLREGHAAIAADDDEGLARSRLADPVPRTLQERYSDKFLERACPLHVELWETGADPPSPARALAILLPARY